jgi:hypothetical protein
MLTPQHRASWQTPTGYAASHCRRCAAGWTRTGTKGAVLTVCLLDREPVLAEMADCDRFEAKEPAPPGA